MNRKCLKFPETSWAMGWVGHLVSYWPAGLSHGSFIFTQSMKTSGYWVGNAHSVSIYKISWVFPEVLHHSLSIAKKVSTALQAFPKELPSSFQALPKRVFKIVRRLSQYVLAHIWSFPVHFPPTGMF
jgi:hypothetical protein